MTAFSFWGELSFQIDSAKEEKR